MNKRILLLGALVVVLISGGVIFSKLLKTNTVAPNSSTQGEIVVKLPTIQGSGPVLIAEELGFFKEQGIKINEVGTVTSGNQLQSVITGDIDFTVGNHADRVVEAIAKGIPVKVVLAQSETTKDMPHMKWMVLKDSPIYGPKDLVGKKIAMSYITGGCPVTNLREYLRKGGVDIQDVTMIQMNDNMQEGALKQGLIDVATVHSPGSGLLINRGGARVLFSDFDTFGSLAGNNMAASEKLIKKDPEKIRRYVAAIVKAQEWIDANQDEADKIYAKKLDLKPEVIKYFDRQYYSQTGLERDERIQLWIDELVNEGEIKAGQIKATDVYTNEFNPNYKK
ncbi:MAG TPA: ABC transporter substrate-binding protein [Negativicutes bacterium]